MNKLIFFLLITTFSLAQEKKQSTFDEKTEQAKAQKAKLDSLLKGTPIGVDAGVGMNARASVGGKEITPRDIGTFFTEILPDLGLKIKEQHKENKKNREKKKKYSTEYEGVDILRRVANTGSGDRITQYEFHVLKTYKEPNGYAPEIFWYNIRERNITKSALGDNEAEILHGPYKKFVAGNLIEEGYFYEGAKNGRWELYDANFMLLDKSKWHKGFPFESVITYYDSAHTKIKEVVPFQFGKRKGEYRMYYEAGQLMVKGQYDNDVKVGLWSDFYQFKPTAKKNTRYPAHWYDEDEPVVLKEWDSKGKVTYERPKEAAVTEQ